MSLGSYMLSHSLSATWITGWNLVLLQAWGTIGLVQILLTLTNSVFLPASAVLALSHTQEQENQKYSRIDILWGRLSKSEDQSKQKEIFVSRGFPETASLNATRWTWWHDSLHPGCFHNSVGTVTFTFFCVSVSDVYNTISVIEGFAVSKANLQTEDFDLDLDPDN